MASALTGEPLSLWEKADRFAGNLSVLGAVLYSVITGAFRGKSGAKHFNQHVIHAAIRRAVRRLSSRQLQFVYILVISGFDEQLIANQYVLQIPERLGHSRIRDLRETAQHYTGNRRPQPRCIRSLDWQ